MYLQRKSTLYLLIIQKILHILPYADIKKLNANKNPDSMIKCHG